MISICEERNGCLQGCQISFGTTYRNGKISTQWPQNASMTLNIPNGHKIIHSKPSKVYQNLDLGYENMPSGNLAFEGKTYHIFVTTRESML
jgi:hypothetical protein